VVGLSVSLDLDVILSSMTMGFVVTNLAPKRSEDLFRMARGMSIPIYVLFFVLVGARLNMRIIPGWVWGVAAIYVLGRSGGEFFGTWLGAKQSKADPVIRKYCGLGLFAQGGVAIGLSVVAGHSLQGIQVNESMNLGEAIVAVVTSTTLIVQVLGPPMTKLAVKLSGEMGRNITEEDVARKYKVADSMTESTLFIGEGDTLERVVNIFADSGLSLHPVLDKAGKLVGIISFDALREALPDRESWAWLLASDVMSQAGESVTPDVSLQKALNIMRSTNSDALLVTAKSDSAGSAGVIERGHIQSFIRQKMLTEG
jgi:CBS domain-containing protein